MEYLQYSTPLLDLANKTEVLNLIINGIPSILKISKLIILGNMGFKPYYKWNTFNTLVLTLKSLMNVFSFKPYYKWNTFNTTNKGVLDLSPSEF